MTDSTYTTYGYDDDAQLTNSLGYTSGGSPIAAEQLGFVYDPGWSMTNRSVNGSPTRYTVNDLNQATSDGVNNYYYDANGNRTSGGQGGGSKVYNYDDENRLTNVYLLNSWRTGFTYDGLGRLRVRTEYTWYYNQWSVASTTRYIYDGKRVIQERDGNNTPTVCYSRGKDLSGTLEGAGGIGGLLARSHGYSGGNWSTHNFYHADGNGNITYLVNSSQGLAASYKYDPYGRLISSSGSLASANLYRFSSKEFHASSGLYYYLYRFYDPDLQRWLNRDPIEEDGGVNVYGFVANNPTLYTDLLGLTLYKCSRKAHFPFPGAQHVYLWDSSSGKGCGEGGGFRRQHGVDKPGDRGPRTPGHICSPIPNSGPVGPAVIACCLKKTHDGRYCPWKSDCHTFLGECLRDAGLHDPEIYGRVKGPADWAKDKIADHIICRVVPVPNF